MALTVPWLVAEASGQRCEGPLRCFYCGAPCDGEHPVSRYVQDSFNGRTEVVAPGSSAVCAGCVLCLREDATIDLIDGTRGRHVTKSAMRAFSWLVTPAGMLAASKAHRAELTRVLLDPPEPPWALVLADSGKRHLLYRGRVNLAPHPPWTVSLEGELISYTPDALADRIDLVGRLVAVWGKPALPEPISAGRAIAVFARYGEDEADRLLRAWGSVAGEPLTWLAAWLSPAKEECAREYPGIDGGGDAPAATADGHGGDPTPAGGTGRSRPAGRESRRAGRDPRDRGPTLFDLGEPLR